MGSKGRGRFQAPAPQNPMLKQLEKLQNQMMQAQEALGSELVTGTAGGGAVSVTLNGHREMKGIQIAPEVVDPQDVTMLQDLIMAAYNDAAKKAEELTAAKMGPLGGGLNIPGLM